ncbi:hypothetical protein EJB05_11461 [Eragrostis curvula]|uniref:DUF6598 domain-containing protein n=1 Tax=Eragrostis curvula TaxID=38414 RepID=A0A5J9VRD8_9POAL|nr:hypothetical protein EJB05_11461 [Eragrostis curvula]
METVVAMVRGGRRKEKPVRQPKKTKAELEDEKAEREDLDRRFEEYLRLSAMAPDVEVVVKEEGALPPSADEEPQDCFGLDLCAIIGMKGEEKKAAARLVLDAWLAENNAREREVLKAEPMEPAANNRRKVEERNEDSDPEQWFRDGWADSWSRFHGAYEDTTKLGPMRFTDDPAPEWSALPRSTLQVFSVKVAGIRGGLRWPLDVFGNIVVRDSVDFNRNIIFNRSRDSCQTLTEENQCLALAGPTRGVVWCDTIIIEANLTVKGTTESEDKDLSVLAVPLIGSNNEDSRLFRCYETSKLSTLGFTLGHIAGSVEATIFVRLINGSCFGGKFSAFAAGIRHRKVKRIHNEEIVLLDSGREKVPNDDNGEIQLSRRVVSVETGGVLKIKACVRKTSESDKMVGELVFRPKKAERSYGVLDAGFCKMQVTVAWSLMSLDGRCKYIASQ